MAEHLSYDDSTSEQRDRMTPVARQQRREILDLIRLNMHPKSDAPGGMTAPEIALIKRFPISDVRRRLRELQEQSQVNPSDGTRPGPMGEEETIWTTT